MSNIHIYHPSKSGKGFACSFWGGKDGSLFFTLVKQSSWNESTQTGSFKESLGDPTKITNVKMSQIEAAAIIDCIESQRPFSTVHKNDDYTKSITFGPWMFNSPALGTNKPPAIHKGYSLAVNITKDSGEKNAFYIGFSFPEARLLKEYITHHLASIFSSNTEVHAGTAPKSETN